MSNIIDLYKINDNKTLKEFNNFVEESTPNRVASRANKRARRAKKIIDGVDPNYLQSMSRTDSASSYGVSFSKGKTLLGKFKSSALANLLAVTLAVGGIAGGGVAIRNANSQKSSTPQQIEVTTESIAMSSIPEVEAEPSITDFFLQNSSDMNGSYLNPVKELFKYEYEQATGEKLDNIVIVSEHAQIASLTDEKGDVTYYNASKDMYSFDYSGSPYKFLGDVGRFLIFKGKTMQDIKNSDGTYNTDLLVAVSDSLGHKLENAPEKSPEGTKILTNLCKTGLLTMALRANETYNISNPTDNQIYINDFNDMLLKYINRDGLEIDPEHFDVSNYKNYTDDPGNYNYNNYNDLDSDER